MDELDDFDCHIVPASLKPFFFWSDEDLETPMQRQLQAVTWIAIIATAWHGVHLIKIHG
jgi:hypothetical protein